MDLDADNKGYVSANDFVNYFADDLNIGERVNFKSLILYWNGSKRDERLMLSDLEKGFKTYTPASHGGSFGGYGSRSMDLRGGGYDTRGGFGGSQRPDQDQKQILEQSYKDQLKLVIIMTDKLLEPEINENGEIISCMTPEEAQRLWEELDQYNFRSISAN